MSGHGFKNILHRATTPVKVNVRDPAVSVLKKPGAALVTLNVIPTVCVPLMVVASVTPEQGHSCKGGVGVGSTA